MSAAARPTAQAVSRPLVGGGTQVHGRPAGALPLALGIGALDLVLGLYINVQLHYLNGDAFSRVANAYYVLYGRNPHLAAIGFIWNPLPSVMELPFLFLRSVWPALAADAVASLFVSAAFAGIAVYYLSDTLRLFGLGTVWRITFALLFACNPMIAFYSANGMSDIMLVGAMAAAVRGTVGYVLQSSLADLIAAGVWLAVAFGIRYEGAPLGVFLALGLGIALWWLQRGAREIRGGMLLLLAPLLYVSGLWVYLNWLIMKQPLYFLDSAYGNVAQTSMGLATTLAGAQHHIIGSLLFVAHMGLLFWPVAVGLVAAVALSVGKWRDPIAPVLIGATVGMPLLQVALVFEGHSGGWARYFIYYIPNGILLLAFAASRVRRTLARNAALIVAALLCIGGNAVNLYEETNSPVVGYGDTEPFTGILVGKRFVTYRTDDQIATYLDRHPKLTVLLDSFDGYPIVLRVRNPRQLIITSDTDFQSVLENPAGRVDALLVPQPDGDATLDAVNRSFPKLWAGGVPWAHLMASFPGGTAWRLYGVGAGAP